MLPAGFLVSCRTQDFRRFASPFRLRVSHPLRTAFPCRSAAKMLRFCGSFYPGSLRFGLLRFRSPLLTESRLISSPAGTGMFRFPASRLPAPLPPRDAQVAPVRVSPFGHRRISACLRLPGAFRCSLRPSSPLCAQAFAIRPFFLDLCF